MGQINWAHEIFDAGKILVPIFLVLWRMHSSNSRKLNELVGLRRFFPPHAHVEKAGTLTVDGIRYPPTNDISH